MSKMKLPSRIKELPNGPHKRDEIRRYKKLIKKGGEKWQTNKILDHQSIS